MSTQFMIPVDIRSDLRDRQHEEGNHAKVRDGFDLSPRLDAILMASQNRAEPSRSEVTDGGGLDILLQIVHFP